VNLILLFIEGVIVLNKILGSFLVTLICSCEQEYVDDGIDWAKVEFEDNQDCLNLFEKVCASTFFSLLAICNN
jgi:myosin heavy subunit